MSNVAVGRDRSICAINQSRCAIERSIWSRSHRADRAMNIFARLTDRAASIFFLWLADRAGKALHDRPILQEKFCAIDRSCRKIFARSTDHAGMGLRDQPIMQEWFRAFARLAGKPFLLGAIKAIKFIARQIFSITIVICIVTSHFS